MGVARNVKLGLATLAALAGSVAVAGPALAQNASAAPDPQESNVPYLAWRGEQVRLVKCSEELAPATSVSFFVEDWSGDQFRQPNLVGNSERLFTGTGEREGLPCAKATFITLHAGLARIKMKALDEGGNIIAEHQFLAGWMSLNTPSLVASADSTNAGGDNVRLVARVTGTMPLDAELGLGTSATLPDDWATLAERLATDSNPAEENPSMNWDIHDDQLNTEGHAGLNSCLPRSGTGIDAVDNCLPSPLDSGAARVFGQSFSHIFGYSNDPTYGPFDPQRPFETLLSDGKLDADDAPMPAARIDFRIAPNSGDPGDISGVGSFSEVSKYNVYSRNGIGTDNPHNLYAPYYRSYIPATTAPAAEASGIDGTRPNNFPGFLHNERRGGLYSYWDFASTLTWNFPSPTRCLLRDDDLGAAETNDFRVTPEGPARVALYSDEHGEVQTDFAPGTGFFFDSLFDRPNENGGCDLQGIDVLGTATIDATARYPYQPTNDTDKASAPVDISVLNLFSKNLTVFPKGTSAEDNNARIVLAHAQDIDGTPFAGEVVCFSVDGDAESAKIFDKVITMLNDDPSDDINLTDTRAVSDPESGLHRVCGVTNEDGNVAIEVFNSNGTVVNVIADFLAEGLLRHVFVDFAAPTTPPPGGGGSPPPVVTPPAGGVAGVVSHGGLVVSTQAPAQTAVKPAAKGTYRVVSVAVRNPLRSSRYLQIRVNGPAGTAQVKIRLVGAKGKTLRTVTRTIAANKVVRIANLKLTKAVKTVRVTAVN